MKAFTLFFAILLYTHAALSCANMTGGGTKYDGSHGDGRIGGAMALKNSILMALQDDGAQIEADLRGSTNFNDRSDYAVALMYLGRSPEAVQRLQELEKERPGEYFVAANLGTALELTGDNEQAVTWIKEGMRRNPDSHEGTEWLHVKILEAKIAQKQDPDYFKKHSVLDLDPAGIDLNKPVGNTGLDQEKVREALQYQLTERLKFVKPPDPAVASLLFDYAMLEAAMRSMESAKGILRMALDYGYPNDKVVALSKRFDSRIAVAKIERYTTYAILGGIGIAGLVFLRRHGHFRFV